MDLWIKNQDKTKLMKVNVITLSVLGGNIFCDGEIFGEYETRNRALEILNEIQNSLKDGVIVYELPEN